MGRVLEQLLRERVSIRDLGAILEALLETAPVNKSTVALVEAARQPVLAAWNGLMIASLAKGFAVLDDPRCLDAAERAADFVLAKMQKGGRLLRSYRNGQVHLMAYIDDYAFLIDGLIGLYEATGTLRWLTEAERLAGAAIEHYWDASEGGFFFTASDAEALIVRSKQSNDNAIPSGNAVMLMNFLRLDILLGRHTGLGDLREKAAAILSLFSGAARQSAFGHERFLSGLELNMARRLPGNRRRRPGGG